MKKRFLILLLMLILISMLFACEPDIVRADSKVESIAVDGMRQYYYFVGDQLNIEDAQLYVSYENGNIEIIPLERSMIDPQFTTDYPGIRNVVVRHKGVTTTFEVEILDLIIERVELKTMPNKTSYIEGTEFDVTGATIDVFFEGGRVINVQVLKNNVVQYNPNVTGNQIARVAYRGRTLNIPIVIVPKQLESISVKTLPTNKAVFVGHDINPAGMVLNFHYNNRKTEEVNAKDLPNLEFEFNNTIESPSVEVKVKYTLHTGVDSYKEFFTTFRTQVLKRVWKSMRIIQYPVTNGILLEPAQYDEKGNIVRSEVRTPTTDMQNIIQGDTIDLSSGIVEVTFDDNTTQRYAMSDHLLKVYNLETIERSEIEGLTIEPIEKKNVPVGDCIIDYSIKISESKYIYESDPEIKITAKKKNGSAVPVIKSNDKNIIEVEKGEIYTVTITASVITTQVIDNISQDVMLISSKSFRIMGEGAVESRRTLDISASGNYKLSIIYMENQAWSILMNVAVVNRKPVSLELSNYQDVTNPEKPYIIGDKINISFVKYRLIYDNGDIDPWAPVNTRMLSAESTLNCDYVTSVDRPKNISFSLYGVTSQALRVNVIPLTVEHLEVDPPINTYVAQGASINPAGATLTAYMNNNTKLVYSLSNIIGVGESNAQITNDPESEGNNIIREITPYIATVHFRHKTVTFEYYVVERLVDSLQLIRDENAKTTYFENEPLSLSGLSLRVRWRNSSIPEIIPVTMDMLYKYDPYKTGPQTLRIRYRGVLNETFSIMVLPRQIEEITIVQKPKLIYIYGIDEAIDLSGIRISKKYNDGTEEEQIGIQLGLNGAGHGWSSNNNFINFRLLYVPQTVILTYKDYFNFDNPIRISYEIEIRDDAVEAIYINHPGESSPSNLIGIVSKGMDLNLYNSYTVQGNLVLTKSILYVKFYSSEILREVPLTPNMVKYEKADITVGDRIVQVVYNDVSCYGYVRVLDMVMSDVSVQKTPKTNYILGEDLDLTEGIVRRTFINTNTLDSVYDYMPMQVEGITVTGFDKNLKESDYGPNEKFKERLITVHYLNFSYSFNVRIYKKFNANISYFSTISFYGDVSLPFTLVNMDIEGFALPQISTYFINLTDVIASLPDGYIEVVTYDEALNIQSIRYFVNSAYYIKVILEHGVVGYIEESKIMTTQNYPTSPPQGLNRYLILVRVQGNRYYNAINYAQREFRIINKYISVNAVVPNENAIVWRYNTSDNARAVYLVSNYIELAIMTDSTLNIILASPTYSGFEIIVINPGISGLAWLKSQIDKCITESWWSYIEVLFNQTTIREIKQEDMPAVNDPIRKKLQILSWTQTRGVNYRVFGEDNDIISYYVPSGGLIAVRDSDNFFVMELFTGQLYRSDFERFDVIYDVNGVLINGFDIEDHQLNQITTVISGYDIKINQGQSTSLYNPNYFINFASQKFIVAPRAIVETEFIGAINVYDEIKDIYYDVVRKGYDGEVKHIDIRYRTEENGEWYNLNPSQIRYYYIDGENEIAFEEGEYPIVRGLYRTRITHNYTTKEGYADIVVWECYLEIF